MIKIVMEFLIEEDCDDSDSSKGDSSLDTDCDGTIDILDCNIENENINLEYIC